MSEQTPFDVALVNLRTVFPETFHLEVEAHVFQDLPTLAAAHEMAASMENMKAQAKSLGYVVVTKFEQASQRWVYDFKRRKGFVQPGRDADVKAIEIPVRPDPVAQLPEPAVEEPKGNPSE